MRGKRTKKAWWSTPLGWIVGIGMVFAAIPVSSFVQTDVNAWAAPLAWAALAIGALVIVGFFTRIVPGLLASAIAGFSGGFAFILSLLEGWNTQLLTALDVARIALAIATIGFIVAVVAWSQRFNRRVSTTLHEVGQAIHTDALFSDDGERIITHPNPLRLLGYIGFQGVFVAAGAFGLGWALANTSNPLLIGGVGFLLAFMALYVMLELVRLIMRGPSLVIGPDGVLDNGSQIVTGRGLIRWDEIVTVFEYTYKPNKISPMYHMLVILLSDAKAVKARQPLAKRALGFIGRGSFPSSLTIVRALVDQPTDALAEQIKRYARSHAPRGWESPLIADDDDGEDGEASRP